MPGAGHSSPQRQGISGSKATPVLDQIPLPLKMPQVDQTVASEALLSETPAGSQQASFESGNADESHWETQHPWRLLAFFCSIMFLVWFDNGLFASNGITGCSKNCDDPVGFPTAQGDFSLSKFQLGILAAMFMVGLMVASVALTQFTHQISPFRLIGVGMSIWVLAAVCSGLSVDFWTLLVARMFVGAGEASIITLSAPFIDDVAPKASVSLWFAILSSAPPIGVAIGYVFGGLAEVIGWRACFFIEAAAGIPIILIAIFVPDVKLNSGPNDSEKESLTEELGAVSAFPVRRFWKELKVLHAHPCFVLNTFGTVPIQATVGAFTFWGPKVAAELFHLSSDTANLSLGGVTIASSLIGVLGGGALLDSLGASIRSALGLQLAASLIGLVFCSLAITLIKTTFWFFCIVFGVGCCGLMAATAPLYAVGMWSIPPPQRPIGQAYLVVAMHALGDVPSPPIVGALQGWIHNWHYSLLIIILTLCVSVVLYSWSLVKAKDAPDYRDEPQDL